MWLCPKCGVVHDAAPSRGYYASESNESDCSGADAGQSDQGDSRSLKRSGDDMISFVANELAKQSEVIAKANHRIRHLVKILDEMKSRE